MNSIIVIIIFVTCCIAAFLSGCVFEHMTMVTKRPDGKIIVKKTSDDEIATLFELGVTPEELLTKSSFYLKVVHKD